MNAAVIGCGPHGRRVIQLLGAQPGVRLAAVCDANPAALAAVEVPADTARHASADAMYAAGGIDLVAITTNGPSHAPLALAALHAGVRRILVEKPMGCSVAECDEMVTAARAAGARLAVDQMRRVDPVYQWIRAQIASGAWGALRLVHIQRPGIGLGCLATHSFDLVRFLAGDRAVTAVTAWVDPFLGPNPRGTQYEDPGGLVVLALDGGARATIAQIEDGAGPATIEIHLTGARIRIDERAKELELIVRDLSVKPGPGRPPAYAKTPLPEGVTSTFELMPQVTRVLAELVGDGPLACDAVHGLASVEILAAAHLSAKRGHAPVALPLGAEDRKHWMPVT